MRRLSICVFFSIILITKGSSQEPGAPINEVATVKLHISINNAMAKQNDGKIVTVGADYIGSVFKLSRFNPDLTPDLTLNYNPLSDYTGTPPPSYFSENGQVFVPNMRAYNAVAVQIDNKILAGGQVLIRFNPNGSIDSSFGTNGIITDADARDIKVLCDGKIIVLTGSGVKRLHPNGTIDQAFGVNGIATLPFTASSIEIQPDGKILVNGDGMIRLNPDGSVDNSFALGALPPGVMLSSGFAIQEDGKIVVAASFNSDLAVIRLNVNGSVDQSFNQTGLVTVEVNDLPTSPNSIAVQDDNKIVIVGNAVYNPPCPCTGYLFITVARFNSNGSLDLGFGVPTSYSVLGLNGSQNMTFNGIGKTVYGSQGGFARVSDMILSGNSIYTTGSLLPPQRHFGFPDLTVRFANDAQPLQPGGGITAPANIEVSTDPGTCTASNVQLGSPVIAGTCFQSVTNNAPAVFPRGITTVTWTLLDYQGNVSTAKQTITVTDAEKPLIQAPAAQYFCATASNYTIPSPVYRDNCSLAGIMYSITGATVRSSTGDNASGLYNSGTSTITWRVLDMSGNASTATTTVHVSSSFQATINDSNALDQGVNANTVYKGYDPASSLELSVSTQGTGPYTYRWSNGATTPSITVSPSAATNYTVTVTDAAGCSVQASKTINVEDVRCGNKNDKVMVCHVAPGNGNSKSLCISSNAVASHLKNGSYLGSCSNVTAPIVHRAENTSSKVNSDRMSVTTFSNPTSAQFGIVVHSSNTKEKVYFRVYSADGRLLKFRTVNANQRFNFGSNYMAGIYLAEVSQGDKKESVRLVKID